MATTTNYGWILPTVSSDVNTWGTILNNLLNVDTTVNSVDTVVNAISILASAAMPKSGGIFTADIELAVGARLVEDQSVMAASEVDWAVGNFFTRTMANGANTLTFANPPTSAIARIRATPNQSSTAEPMTVQPTIPVQWNLPRNSARSLAERTASRRPVRAFDGMGSPGRASE